MLLEEEIEEEYEVRNVKVKTPDGMKDVKRVFKTVPLPVWVVSTKSYTLRCSGHHIVQTNLGLQKVWELRRGDLVNTESGFEEVVEVRDTGLQEPLYDLTVDDDKSLFYSGGIVSHNSTTYVARQLINSHLFPRYKSLYVAPYNEHKKTYAQRYIEMESLFRAPIVGQNKFSKTYDNGSTVEIIHCLLTADRARGKTVDEILIDEAQNMDPELIPELTQTQSMSDAPSLIFAGTALSIDTLLEYKWQQSSMGTWYVRDGKGGWLNMGDKEVLSKVCDNPRGPTCPATGKLLDVRNGYYVHHNKKAMLAGDIGIHVPQCIIPDLAYSPIRWGQIYKRIQRENFNKILQECFGIAVAEGTREITEQDLQRMCVIKESTEVLKARCKNGYYRAVISGCDWGGSDYNQAAKSKTSYTVHCIIGVAPNGTVDILHWRRYSGMDYPEIAEMIVGEHRAWNGTAIATDFGVGMAYNMEIRKYLDLSRHFIMSYVGPTAAPLASPKNAHMANQLSLNRTEALTAVFKAVKDPSLPIRARGWESNAAYLTDFLNMYRLPTETAGGQTTFRYMRPPSKADDALHAFTFAYAIAKVFLGESIVDDPALERDMRNILHGKRSSGFDVVNPSNTFLSDMVLKM